MSDQIITQSVRLESRTSFPKITRYFDVAEYCVERAETLLTKSKPAVISLFLLVHLVIDLIVVLVVLLRRSG